jgi:hypothetical protein
MKVTVFLADAAQSGEQGKVHALGLGWSITNAPTPPHAVVALIDLTRQEVEAGPHTVSIKLFERDEPVVLPDAVGSGQEVGFAGGFTTTMNPDAPEDATARVSIALNVGAGLPLLPGQRFEWRVTIDEKHDPSWVAVFHTRLHAPLAE